MILYHDTATLHSACRTRIAGSYFTENCWTVRPKVVTLPHQTVICLGLRKKKNNWEVADSAVVRKYKWLFVKSCLRTPQIVKKKEFLTSSQEGQMCQYALEFRCKITILQCENCATFNFLMASRLLLLPRVSYVLLVIKPTRCTSFSNLFLE